MKSTLIRSLSLATVALSLSAALSAKADVIFENDSTRLSTTFFSLSNGTEVGDQINLSSTAYLTNFSFEFFGTVGGSTNSVSYNSLAALNVKIYLNDGPLFNTASSPSNLLWSSGWLNFNTMGLKSTSGSTLDFTPTDFGSWDGNLQNATTLTWSITTTNLAGGETFGPALYGPATVGSDPADYWQNDGSGWMLLTNETTAVEFGAVMAGTVPEPSFYALSALGVVGYLWASRHNRKKQA